jgi:diguanylate cyclase (GGDEF)-like protein
MRSPFASLDIRLRQLPDPALLSIGLAAVAGIAVFRVTVGHGVPLIDFVDFFLIPVAGVGWLTRSRGYGLAAALVAAVASVAIAVVGEAAAPFGAAATAGAARLVLYLIVLSLLGAMRRMQVEREAEARTDPLTGATNVRAFGALALAEVERSQRYQHELSLAYIDIDDFKAINDGSGHAEGDHVLLQVSHVMRSVARSVDTVARLGGDEFAILMPETGPSEARALVDRLRRDLAGLGTEDGHPVCIADDTQTAPQISGGTVVWGDFGYSLPGGYGYDLATKTEILISGESASSPAISGSIVVWTDGTNGDSTIYAYNLARRTTFAVCTAGGDQVEPAVSESTIVWEEWRNDGGGQIFGLAMVAGTGR